MEKKYIINVNLQSSVIAALSINHLQWTRRSQGYFSGADFARTSVIIEQTGYIPWFSSIWEPPSGRN